MTSTAVRNFLSPGALVVAAALGFSPAAQAYDVFTYVCEIRKPAAGSQAWSTSDKEYDVTYHIDLTSMTYTASLYKDPAKRYPIHSVEDDGSIRLTRDVNSAGYETGGVTIHPEKGTYRYFLQDHNFQVSHHGTCKVIE